MPGRTFGDRQWQHSHKLFFLPRPLSSGHCWYPQVDDTRPDQVILLLAEVFLHFVKHANTRIRAGMTKRIEKRWLALDQAMFVFALVLNPYEMLSRFGDKATLTSLP